MQKKEFAVLTLLEQSEEALTQRQITAELGFSVGSVNKIVKKLTDEGLIANGHPKQKLAFDGHHDLIFVAHRKNGRGGLKLLEKLYGLHDPPPI